MVFMGCANPEHHRWRVEEALVKSTGGRAFGLFLLVVGGAAGLDEWSCPGTDEQGEGGARDSCDLWL